MQKKTFLMQNYKRDSLSFEKGEGCFLYAKNGKKYLDFIAGVAVNALGYGHKKMLKAIENSYKKPLHVSNLFKIPEQENLAKKLCQTIDSDFEVMFVNSGTEANEAALKLARKKTGKKDFISFSGAFHGRTFGSLSVTPKPKIQKDFVPLLANCKKLEFNSLQDLDKINDKASAIVFEFVQGEGGINIANPQWIKKLFQIAKEKKILLIADEVQTGIGRTGNFFGFQNYGVLPDIVTLAKGLGGGVPIGAVLAKKNVAEAFSPGSHGSTFAGSPFISSISSAVVDEISKPKFLEKVQKNSDYFLKKLKNISKKFPKKIKEVRGLGFLIGIEFFNEKEAQKVSEILKKKYAILTNVTAEKVLRLIPPLIITKKELNLFLKKFLEIL